MSEKIKLVQGDTRPQLRYVVTDETTGQIVDISGATTKLRFRAAGTTVVLFTLTGYLQSGIEDEDGNVTQAGPGQAYETPGKGGRVAFQFGAGNLDVPPGAYEGELEVTFGDTSVQTVYSPTKFVVRAQF